MLKTEYCVVRIETYQHWEEPTDTYEEAYEIMKREMEKYKCKPNHSFQIVKIQFENCTSKELNEKETDSHSEK